MKSAHYLISVLLILWMAACSPRDGNVNGKTILNKDSVAGTESGSIHDSAALNTTVSDQNNLVGDWERTDGEYTLRIYSASADGKLDATYFNPGSINVARAEWSQKDNHYVVVVELQDVNYPGSTYTLEYIPDGDRLTGNYYQAVEKVDYEVAFTRKPETEGKR